MPAAICLPHKTRIHAATPLNISLSSQLFFFPFSSFHFLSGFTCPKKGDVRATTGWRRRPRRRRRRRHLRRPPEDPRAFLCSCVGVAGAGEHPAAPSAEAQGRRQGRQSCRSDSRCHRRRRGVLRPPPLRRQVRRGGRGGVRGAHAGAGARAPGAVAEAVVPGGDRGTAHPGHGGGRAAAGQALRRAAAVPAVHEASGQGVQGRGEDGGVALPPGERPLAGARPTPAPPRGRSAAAQVAAEAGGAAGVRGAERGDGLPAAHLHGGLHGGRAGGAGAGQVAVPGVRDDVPGPAAPHPPLFPVPPYELLALPAHVAAPPPPRRALRPTGRPVQHTSLRAVEAQGAGEGSGEGRRRRRQVGASGEEGEGCQGHVFSEQEEADELLLSVLSKCVITASAWDS